MDENKLKIARNFLLDAPPGEFHERQIYPNAYAYARPVDLRTLVNSDDKLQTGIKDAVHGYNIQQFIVAKLDNQSVLVSKHGELDENTFYNPRLNRSFKFDHIRQVASGAEDYQHSSPLNSLRAEVDPLVNSYVQDHYPDGVSAVYAKSEKIVIVSVSNKYNPANFWNGRWRSEWSYKPASGTLHGLMRVQVHYYEDGNVQLNTDREVTLTVPFTDDVTTGSSIALKIMTTESEYQDALNENYNTLSETTFKSLRRILPVTRNKIDWNKIATFKLGSSLAH